MRSNIRLRLILLEKIGLTYKDFERFILILRIPPETKCLQRKYSFVDYFYRLLKFFHPASIHSFRGFR